jgi:hypothetical protein
MFASEEDVVKKGRVRGACWWRISVEELVIIVFVFAGGSHHRRRSSSEEERLSEDLLKGEARWRRSLLKEELVRAFSSLGEREGGKSEDR